MVAKRRKYVGSPRNAPSSPRLVSVSDISDRGIRLVVQGKVDARGRFPAESAFRERMLRALDAAGVELVTAQRMQMIEVPASPAEQTPRA